jgi:hypothetical protein
MWTGFPLQLCQQMGSKLFRASRTASSITFWDDSVANFTHTKQLPKHVLLLLTCFGSCLVCVKFATESSQKVMEEAVLEALNSFKNWGVCRDVSRHDAIEAFVHVSGWHHTSRHTPQFLKLFRASRTADGLTKVLPKQKQHVFRELLGMREIRDRIIPESDGRSSLSVSA